MSAASSDIIEKYLLSLISCDKLFTMIAPTVVIISFWMVLEIYVAFLGAVSRWCCSVWSPLSIRNSNSACGPLRAKLFFLQKIIVFKRDFRISRFLLICCWSKLMIRWSIGTDSLVIFLRKFSIAITAKLCISHFPLVCDMADVQSVSADLYNLSSLFEFRSHWTPKKTHGEQNASSRYLEYHKMTVRIRTFHWHWEVK